MVLKGRKRSSGFTLVELMIVVAIIGILAAVAIPAFTKYVKKSRTAEPLQQLNKMWAGSVAYYESDWMSGQTALPKQFPAPLGDGEAGGDCSCRAGSKCPGNDTVWDANAVWQALNFSIGDPHVYIPVYSGDGVTGTASTFTAESGGDLDCDMTRATFTRNGAVDAASGNVIGSFAPTILNELE